MIRITRQLSNLDISPKGSIVSIGVFDGVHTGHRSILAQVADEAAKTGRTSIVLTFDPHPRTVLQPEHPPRRLDTVVEKIALFDSMGIENVVVLPFDREFASTAARDFVLADLVARLQMRKLIVGYDFRFGRNREGDGQFLHALGREAGFDVELTGPLEAGGEPIKSTRIRDLLEEGRVDEASRLLERFYSVSGQVVRGAGRGRQIGIPTANIIETDGGKLWPGRGVYALFSDFGEGVLPAVANVGVAPTFGGETPTIETHVFDYGGDLVGRTLSLHLVKRIRREIAFASPTDLAARIAEDCREAAEILNETDQKFVFTAENQFDTFRSEWQRASKEKTA